MKKSTLKILLSLLLLFLFSCSKDQIEILPVEPIVEDTFIRGADVSFLPLIENEGTVYKYNGIAQNPLTTLKNAGCNTVRIRLWKNPTIGQSTFNEVKALALRAKQAGFKIWLSVHYSDTWADPGAQTTPIEWSSLSFSELKIALNSYTTTILTEIQPDIIQIGNEINNGFVWPEGHLINNEAKFLDLLTSISNTIRAQSPSTKIMLHYAGIGSGAEWFFNKVNVINYDYIGLSYYPLWHGKVLTEVSNTINYLGQAHNKKVIIAETAYPFTLNWNDWTNNIVGLEDQLIPSFTASPSGQKSFMLAIKNLLKQSPHGAGFCYWGGEWIAFRGTQSTNGSPFENQALWDFNNNALPILDAFNQN